MLAILRDMDIQGKKNKLAEICEIAKSKGMSYGQYMAEQYKKEVMIR